METVTFEKPELLPQDVMMLLEPLIAAARKNINEHEDFVPVAFVGRTDMKTGIQVPTHLSDNPSARGMFVRMIAESMNADFAIVFEETWIAEQRGATREEVIAERQKYESVADMPGAISALMMILETPNGCWFARPQIKGEGVGRTLESPVEFVIAGGFEGKFAGLLPRKGQAQ